MIKKIFVLLLVLDLICSATQFKPVIVRDKFTESGYSVYIPADNDGIYWARWSLNWPSFTAPYNQMYIMGDVWYGKVYEGKTQTASAASSTGSWSNVSAAGWNIRRNWYAPATLTWTITATHNRIHIWTYNNTSAGGTLNVTLGGVSIGTINTAIAPSGVTENIVTTAAAGTVLVITTVEGSKYHDVIGITTYDDDKLALPSAATGGVANGNNLITQFSSTVTECFLTYQDCGFAKQLLAGGTTGGIFDTALTWAPTGQEQKWTTYGIHNSEYPFVPTTNSILYIDAVSQGEMWDINNVVLGELHEANDISIAGEGYGDFDSDGVEDPNDMLKMRITYNFTPTGFGLITGIKWTGSADVTNVFCSMLNLPIGMSGNIRLLPDKTNVAIGSTYAYKYGNGVYVYPNGIDCVIHATSSGPIYFLSEQVGGHKLYFQLNPALLEGGTTPVNGDSWPMSMHVDIEKLPFGYGIVSSADLDWDGDVDWADAEVFCGSWLKVPGDSGYNSRANLYEDPLSIVNFYDYAIFANEWDLPFAP